MRNYLVAFLLITIFVSCHSSGKRQNNNYTSSKYITLIDNAEGYSTAYTEDGHTMIYSKDSAGNFIVYYAKQDKDAGKYGYDRIKEKIVRVEMNLSLNSLNSILSVNGGAFCKMNNDMVYDTYYFDEQMNGKALEHLEVLYQPIPKEEIGTENNLKRIMIILNIAYNIAQLISNDNASGWNYIVSSLEPIQNMITYEVITSDAVHDERIQSRIMKIKQTVEGLTHYYLLLQEKMISQNIKVVSYDKK